MSASSSTTTCPRSLDAYYQEAGRAGRDDEAARRAAEGADQHREVERTRLEMMRPTLRLAPVAAGSSSSAELGSVSDLLALI
jgi:superfamily II DNA helicase RecQ